MNLGAGNLPESSTCASGKLPSMALDSGIHAGMTAFLLSFQRSSVTAIKLRCITLIYNNKPN
ncbi:MAG: hypothetical protein WCI11_03560, partial [Candidatus Methylumidiphilus sp.]